MSCRWLLRLALAVAICLSLLAAVHARGKSNVRVLRPRPGSTVRTGWLEIAIVAPDHSRPPTVIYDGKRLGATDLATSTVTVRSAEASSSPRVLHIGQKRLSSGVWIPPVWATVVNATPGEHEIVVGSRRVRFRAVQPAGAANPTSVSCFTAHPPAAAGILTCSACHTLSNGRSGRRFEAMDGFSEPDTPDVCFRCHEEGEFFSIHQHRIEHLALCQVCHDPHGSARKALMKFPPEQVCKDCHE